MIDLSDFDPKPTYSADNISSRLPDVSMSKQAEGASLIDVAPQNVASAFKPRANSSAFAPSDTPSINSPSAFKAPQTPTPDTTQPIEFEKSVVEFMDGALGVARHPVAKAQNESNQFMKGLKMGIDQTQGMLYGAAGMVGSAIGSDSIKDFGVEGYQRNMDEAAENKGDVESVTKIEGLGDFGNWAAHTMGTLIPTMATMLAGGGVGALAGRAAVRSSVKGLAKDAADAKLKKAAVKGGGAGAFGASYALSSGGIYGELLEETGEDRPAVAAAFGAAVAAFDMLPIMHVFNKIGVGKKATEAITKKLFTDKTFKQKFKDYAIAGSKVAAGNAVLEGTTEGIQTIIEKAAIKYVDESKDIFTPENIDEMLNAIAAGGLMGATMGSAGGVISKHQENKLAEAKAQAETAPDETVVELEEPTPAIGVPEQAAAVAPIGAPITEAPNTEAPVVEAAPERVRVDEFADDYVPPAPIDQNVNQEAPPAQNTSQIVESENPDPDATPQNLEAKPEPTAPSSGTADVDLAELPAKDAKAVIEQAEAATKTNPTAKEKETSKYPKGKLKVNGMALAVENPAGSTRSGVDSNGKKWEVRMANTYGEIEGTKGADGDKLDFFMGERAYNIKLPVHIIDQSDTKSGEFDEHKIVFGEATPEAALKTYNANYQKGWTGGKAVTAMPWDKFQTWAKDAKRTKKPVDAKAFEVVVDHDAPTVIRKADKPTAAVAGKKAPSRGSFTSDSNAPRFKIVHHGTPHKWQAEKGFVNGRPRLDKMGIGEGNQAYGWGWYSAEREGVAAGYRNGLSNTTYEYNGGEIDPTDVTKLDEPDHIKSALSDLVTMAGDVAAARAIGKDRLDGLMNDEFLFEAEIKVQEDALTALDSVAEGLKISSSGNLYTLDIPDSDVENYLDWDAPLSEQPASVKELLREDLDAIKKAGVASGNSYMEKLTGEDFYKDLVEEYDFDAKRASEYLAGIGVPGLKYLDGDSRSNGKGSRNYVTWDQDVLDRSKIISNNDITFSAKDSKPNTSVVGSTDKPTVISKKAPNPGASTSDPNAPLFSVKASGKSNANAVNPASAAALFDAPKDVQPVRQKNGRTKVTDLAWALDKRAAEMGYQRDVDDHSPEALDAISDAMVVDIERQLKKDKSGAGWYDLKTRSALELMARAHPELSTSLEAELRLKLLMALISQNNAVELNFKEADKVYSFFKETGKIAPWAMPGKSGDIIKNGITKLFDLIDRNGAEKVADFLQLTKTVADWNKLIQPESTKKGAKQITSELATAEVTGAMAIMGSKIGSFYGNLNGDFTTLTADLWFSRTWNRYTGNMIREADFTENMAAIREAVKATTKKKYLYGFKKMDIRKSDEVLVEYVKAAVKGFEATKYKDKEPVHVKTNTMFKKFDGIMSDIPRNGSERKAMRDAVALAQEKLVKKGHTKLDIADMQAILWYTEKDLFSQYKAVNEKSEKTDYETAAQKILRAKGIDDTIAPEFTDAGASGSVGRTDAVGAGRGQLHARRDLQNGNARGASDKVTVKFKDYEAQFKANESVVGLTDKPTVISKKAVESVARRVTAAWKNGPGVIVYKDFRTLPEVILADARRQGFAASGIHGVFYNGDIHIVSQKAKSELDVERTIAHEAYGHFGLRKLFGDKFMKELDNLYDVLGGEQGLRDLAKRHDLKIEHYFTAAKTWPKDKQRQFIVDEVLAHIQETRVGKTDPKGLKAALGRLITQLRVWLRKNGFINSARMSDGEVLNLLAEAKATVFRPAESQGNGDTRFSVKGAEQSFDDVDAAIREKPSIKEFFSEPKKYIKGKMKDIRPAAMAALTLRHIGDVGKRALPGVTGYIKIVDGMMQRRGQLVEASHKLIKDWDTLDKKDADDMAIVMHNSTLSGVDGDPEIKYEPLIDAEKAGAEIKKLKKRAFESQKPAPHLRKIDEIKAKLAFEEQRKKDYPGIQKAFAELSPAAQKVYRKIRQDYKDRFESTIKALQDRLDRAQETEGVNVDERKESLREHFESARIAGPYFPLARFGEFWVSATNAAGEVDFRMFESSAKAEAFAAEAKATGAKVVVGKNIENIQELSGVPETFIQGIMDVLDEKDVGSNTKDINDIKGVASSNAHHINDLKDSIYQMYLSTLPDASLRKNFIHRKKTPGFSKDAKRAFAKQSFHGAYQLSRLENSDKLQTSMGEMEESVKTSPDRIFATDLYNEMQKRHEWILNPKTAKWSNNATSLGFAWFLGVTPAAGLVNTTQTALVALPLLAAEYGWIKATTQLIKASKDYFAGGAKPKAGEFFDLEKVLAKRAATGDVTATSELRALKELTELGVIDKTLAHDLIGRSETESDIYSPGSQKFMGAVGWTFHHAERYNREVTAMAVYRMARENGKNHSEAVEAAAKLTWESHFDYSAANKARFMQGDWAKVFLMFRQFSLNMTYLLARNAYSSMKGATPEEKKLARRKLAGVLGMHAMAAGAMGLPLYWTVKLVLESMFDDEDEPWDMDIEFQNWAHENLGTTAAVALTKGLGNAFAGVDLSSRVGINDLWLRSSERDLANEDSARYWLEQAGGPLLSVPISISRGMDAMQEGHTLRGMESMLPKALRDILKAMRYQSEGVTSMRGDPIVSEVGAMGVLSQGIGFTPANVARQYDANRGTHYMKNRIKNRRQFLMNRYALATLNGDTGMQSETREDIQRFNRKNPRNAISAKTLRSSMKMRARYSAQADHGVSLSKSYKHIADTVTFGN